jgi:hypothetical protein
LNLHRANTADQAANKVAIKTVSAARSQTDNAVENREVWKDALRKIITGYSTVRLNLSAAVCAPAVVESVTITVNVTVPLWVGANTADQAANKVAIKTVSAARSQTDNAVEKQGGVEGRPAENNHRLFDSQINAVEKQGGVEGRPAENNHRLFDSQIESFCRCLRTSGCRVCYHHSERDRTALGWRS